MGGKGAVRQFTWSCVHSWRQDDNDPQRRYKMTYSLSPSTWLVSFAYCQPFVGLVSAKSQQRFAGVEVS